MALWLLLPVVLAAQTFPNPPAPRFEVVSIRAVAPSANPISRDIDFTPVLPGGKYIDGFSSLPGLISFAYNVKNSKQLVGVPKWATTQIYAIAAEPAEGFPKLPPGDNREQVRLMVRAMLADRFHLQVHSEVRQEPVFNLEVAKGGLKVHEVDPPVPPAKEGFVQAAVGDSGGRIIGNKSTMAGFATMLTVFLPHAAVDRTGLSGYYDFDISWSEPRAAGQAETPGLGSDGIGLLISTLRSRFGLRLTQTSGAVEYWVVDKVEPPTGN